MENNVAELIKWMIVTVALSMLIALGIAGYKFNQLSTYQTYVTEQVQQHGGFTNDAINNINNKSKKYGGMFIVKVDPNKQEITEDDTKVIATDENEFGTKIQFKIQTDIPFFGQPNHKYTNYVYTSTGTPLDTDDNSNGYQIDKNDSTNKVTHIQTTLNVVATSQVGKSNDKNKAPILN